MESKELSKGKALTGPWRDLCAGKETNQRNNHYLRNYDHDSKPSPHRFAALATIVFCFLR